jgi:hypothetical protein
VASKDVSGVHEVRPFQGIPTLKSDPKSVAGFFDFGFLGLDRGAPLD